AVVCGAEGDVMHSAASHGSRQEAPSRVDVDNAANTVMRAETKHRALASDLGKSKNVCENGGRSCTVLQHQHDTVKSADCVLALDTPGAPSGFSLGAGDGDQRHAQTIGIREGEGGFAEPLARLLVGNAAFDETMHPVSQSARRHTEKDLLCLTD